MKKIYESPEVEIFSFTVREAVMDNSDCSNFDCPDGICAVDLVCTSYSPVSTF